MTLGPQMAVLAAIMVPLMSVGWLWQKRHRNAGIVDVLWSLGTGLAALLAATTGTGAAAPRIALAVVGSAWSVRLAAHVWRRVGNGPEDGRYRNVRDHWHDHQGKFYALFMLQAGLVLLFALPFSAVARNQITGITPSLAAGIAIGLMGVGGEAWADRQLARFRADPTNQGRTCRMGWWRYSRHPNYFFEWLHWFAYVALAVGSPIGWLAWSGPVAMYVFLRWISGIPHTEAQALRTRGEEYLEYQRTTSMLIPWFPRRVPKPSHAAMHEKE